MTMARRAAITIQRSREEVERRWGSGEHPHVDRAGGEVRFVEAPGDRGTEIHVTIGDSRGGKAGEAIRKLRGSEPLAKVKDDLRRFKQLVETGVIPRSDAVPEGERLERKFKTRPAQPLDASELEKVGA
jgi:uncharacterized membrane protein